MSVPFCACAQWIICLSTFCDDQMPVSLFSIDAVLAELPGGGATLARGQVLAAVDADDLALAKLYEGHTDALAILAEAGIDGAAGL